VGTTVPDRWSARTAIVRRRSDLAWLAGASLVLAGSSVAIDGNSVAAFEESAFRAANDVPGAIYPVLWPVMQFGTFISVPLVAIGALALKRIRLAIEASAAGVSTYFLAKVVKDLFPRDRPGAFLEEVHLRGIGTDGRGRPVRPRGRLRLARLRPVGLPSATVAVGPDRGRRRRLLRPYVRRGPSSARRRRRRRPWDRVWGCGNLRRRGSGPE
jgi:hypothetical protein